MTDINVHAIGVKNFSICIKEADNNCGIVSIRVGDTDITFYFHDGKIDNALMDIDTAIRVFLNNRQ